MRLRVEIDDELLAKAKEAVGSSKTKAVVEAALRQVVETSRSPYAAKRNASATTSE
jgi:Arc/MetJ family transcription regulator